MHPVAAQFPVHGCMDDLTTERSLIRKLLGSLTCLSYCYDMLCMGACTTRHGQTSGGGVQELNFCTVYSYSDNLVQIMRHGVNYKQVPSILAYMRWKKLPRKHNVK